MKKNNKWNTLIFVLILLSLSAIIAYVALNNTSIMENNLEYTRNSKELSENLEKKANINFEAAFPTQNVLSTIPAKAENYNIFWSNYKIKDLISQNSGALNKLWDITAGQLFLNLSSNSPLNYNIKVVKFDKNTYKSQNTLVPIEIAESAILTTSWWYIQLNNWVISLNLSSGTNFDFKNNDYAIFIQNNSGSSIQANLKWYFNLEPITLNAVNDWNYPNIDLLVNHIISREANYIWDNEKLSFNVYDGKAGVVRWIQVYSWGIEQDGSQNYTKNQTWRNIVFRNGNGSGWTIMDRNLGAENAYTWSNNSSVYWDFFQWWNNYGFPNNWSVSPTSTGQINGSDYWPTNYYYSSTYAIWTINNLLTGDWGNLWWGITNTNEARQWPCPIWWHIPSTLEWDAFVKTWWSYKWKSCDVLENVDCPIAWNATKENFIDDFHISIAWLRNSLSDWNVDENQWVGNNNTYFWSSTANTTDNNIYMFSSLSRPQRKDNSPAQLFGLMIRCFKN